MADLNPPQLVIDNYQTLISNALTHMGIVSHGEMSDTSDGSFMTPFVSTMAYVGSELLYKANLASTAAALSFLAEVVGVPNNPGTQATTTLQFGLSTGLSSNYTIPQGFTVSDATGTLRYSTDADLVLPPGTLSGTVTATAENIRSSYNLPVGTINTVSHPLAYLSYVTNVTAATNGSEPQASSDLINRAAIALRNRNPVGELDFEEFATAILGTGSRAKAIGLLSADTTSEELGSIHLFLLDATGNPITAAQGATVGNTIANRLMLGTKLYISPINLVPIYVEVIVQADGTVDTQTLSDNAWTSLQTYLSLQTYPVGQDVLLEEVKYNLRQNGGFTLSSLTLNSEPLNIAMPNDWSLPMCTALTIHVIDNLGNTTTNSYLKATASE